MADDFSERYAQDPETALNGAGSPRHDIETLAASARRTGSAALPPVETWHPPFCGDIDMRIARDGTWYYQGSPIRRQSLVRLFSRILRKDPERYVLVTPVEMVGIKVDDAPFVAVAMKITEEASGETLRFQTNVEEWVTLDAFHPLRFEQADSGGIKPYILVRGDLWALLKRSLALDLIDRAVPREHQGEPWLGVVSAGLFFPMAKVNEIEGIEPAGPVGTNQS